MPDIYARFIGQNKIAFNVPKPTEYKYNGYKFSSSIRNISNNVEDISPPEYEEVYDENGNYLYKKLVGGGSYNVTTKIGVKDEYGNMTYPNILTSDFSIIDMYKECNLRDNPVVDGKIDISLIKDTDVGKYINTSYPYFEIEFYINNKNLHIYNYTTPYMHFEYTYRIPNINDIKITNDFDNKQYEIIPICDVYDRYTIEITKINVDGNGSDKVSYTFTTDNINKTFIKYSYLQNGLNQINIIAYNGDQSSTYTKTFVHYIPEIDNLLINNANDLIDDTTILTWESVNQASAKIIINDVQIDTVGDVKSYIVPKGIFKEGKNTVTVTVVGISDSGVIGTAEVSKTSMITLSRIKPTVSDVTISNKNTDEPITLTWNSTNQSFFSILGDTDILTTQQSTGKQFTFDAGMINPKYKTITVRIYYNSGFDTIYVDNVLDVSLFENTPIIRNVEPSNRTINIDENINVTFETNEFCDRWILTCNDNLVSNGTTERSLFYTANTFDKGINTIKLVTYYSPSWSNGNVIRSAEKIVTFTGFGQPCKPIFTTKDVYSTSSPKISWEPNSEQTGYEYELYIGDILITSDDELTTNNFFSLKDLVDKTNYTVKVRIKNKYELYSDWSTVEFETLFNDILLPDFYLIEGENCVHITINGYQESTFKEISIYRKQGYSDWVEIANKCNVEDGITDYTCPCNMDLYYKIRVYDTSNSYKDSDAKVIKVSLINYWITDLEDYSKSFRLDFVESDTNYNTNFVYKTYTNQYAPRVFKGKTNYKTITLDVQFSNEKAFEFENFVQTSNNYNAFCYRTWKGERKFVSAVITNMSPVNSQVMKVSLTLTEINFNETEMYSGSGFRKIVYLNGEYYLDGSIDLSGYDDNYVIEEVE